MECFVSVTNTFPNTLSSKENSIPEPYASEHHPSCVFVDDIKEVVNQLNHTVRYPYSEPRDEHNYGNLNILMNMNRVSIQLNWNMYSTKFFIKAYSDILKCIRQEIAKIEQLHNIPQCKAFYYSVIPDDQIRVDVRQIPCTQILTKPLKLRLPETYCDFGLSRVQSFGAVCIQLFPVSKYNPKPNTEICIKNVDLIVEANHEGSVEIKDSPCNNINNNILCFTKKSICHLLDLSFSEDMRLRVLLRGRSPGLLAIKAGIGRAIDKNLHKEVMECWDSGQGAIISTLQKHEGLIQKTRSCIKELMYKYVESARRLNVVNGEIQDILDIQICNNMVEISVEFQTFMPAIINEKTQSTELPQLIKKYISLNQQQCKSCNELSKI